QEGRGLGSGGRGPGRWKLEKPNRVAARLQSRRERQRVAGRFPPLGETVRQDPYARQDRFFISHAEDTMTQAEPHSDALVFFGATGDLAYKKVFPALQGMVRRGQLIVPVIGVAKAGWTLDQFKARARDSVEKHGGLDPGAFANLSTLLRYVDGDYQNPATFTGLRKALGPARHPAHYLPIPPELFRA